MCKNTDKSSPQQHVHVTVTKDVPSEKQAEWLSMANDLASETWKEDGCLFYQFVQSKENKERFVIVEEWESQSKLEAHFSTAHFTKLVPLMDGISTTVELDVSQKCLAVSRPETSPSTSTDYKNHVHVTVTKTVPTEKQEEWLSMATELATGTWKEDGCISYEFVKSKDKSDRFVIVEEWESQAKLNAHFATPHFTKFVPLMDAISTTVALDVSSRCLSVSPSRTSSSTQHVHVTVTKNVPVESQQEWLGMAKELAAETWKEDGCITYDFVRSKENSERFIIVEEWESQTKLDAHFNTPHFTKFVPLMDAISTTVELDVSHKCLPMERQVSDRRKRNGRILIVYDTSTGSTACIADLIAEGALLLDRMEVRVRVVPGPATSWEDATKKRDALHPFATYSDIYWADAVCAGTPTNLGSISYRMKQFWDDFSQSGGWSTTDGKIGSAFTSQGGHGGGGELACMAMKSILMNFGFSVFGITDYVGFMDTMHYGSVIAKKPRAEIDRMKCRRQGLRLAEMVGYYINGRDDANPNVTKNWDTERWGFPGIPPRGVDESEASARTKTRPNMLMPAPKKALIFTKMEDYVHESTSAMAAWVHAKLGEFGWKGVVTDDKDFINNKEKLDEFDLIVFLNNSGQIFDKTENLLAHIDAGKGVVGVHAAVASFLNGKDASGLTIMEPTSDVFETVFGSHFKNHPVVQTGTIIMNDDLKAKNGKLNGYLSSVPAKFSLEDEFFNFTKNVADRDDITVVAWADESTYEGGLMGEKHPIAWYHEMGEKKAPIFYTGLGHFSHFYNGTGPEYVSTILEAGLRYCCGF
eukprot:CAMPEP_0172445528 /NCGR_PEP_ID=MMETSP1065-20121228/5342_1 /TAXON_ID=265537 /ORGANISM="Amphiprora paludosa, Strain CCMP125" /LENGTH=811 /DNA_ID=CAMNT_0013196399 /DNA_START=36 /DNA_END=2471 /DNA_ORIENTATION=-